MTDCFYAMSNMERGLARGLSAATALAEAIEYRVFKLVEAFDRPRISPKSSTVHLLAADA
jgi:hypothetical protein